MDAEGNVRDAEGNIVGGKVMVPDTQHQAAFFEAWLSPVAMIVPPLGAEPDADSDIDVEANRSDIDVEAKHRPVAVKAESAVLAMAPPSAREVQKKDEGP